MPDRRRGNLPLDYATFVGRQDEMARIREMLATSRAVTLIGPGGVGKTRLALRVANDMQAHFGHDCWIIDLSGLPRDTSLDRLYAYLAYGLGIRNQQAGLDVLIENLRDRSLLLVLDNCEHLLAAARECVTALLGAVPKVRILATSRQALYTAEEQTVRIPPLAEAEAIELFTAAATAAAGADVAGHADRQHVAELCRRLDCLPLAIRLAAARMPTLSVGQLIDRLGDRFRILATSAPPDGIDGNPRHAALDTVVSWSYELCTQSEKLLWARSAVFAADFDLAAAEAVCTGAGLDRADLVTTLAGLVEKSVLAVDHTNGPPRYRLLEILRVYGLGKLDAGETQRVKAAHRDYYRTLAARAAGTWLGPGEVEVMAGVHRELPNLLSAVHTCLAGGDVATARGICVDVVRSRAPFFYGFLALALQMLRDVIDATDQAMLTEPAEVADLSTTMAAAGWIAATQGRHELARTLLSACHDLHQRWGLPSSPPMLFAEGGGEALALGTPRAIGLLAGARSQFTGIPGTAGDRHMTTMMWAMACVFADDPAAPGASAEYLAEANAARAPWAISWALWTRALAALRAGRHSDADQHIRDSLRLQRGLDDQWGQTWGLMICAAITAATLDTTDDPRREAKRAAMLLGAADARQRRVGVDLTGLRPLADERDQAYKRIVTAWGDERPVKAALQAGARSHAHALALALREPLPRRGSTMSGLTARQLEVAEVVAQGLTDAQIAAQLGIGVRTVESHVSAILCTMGFKSRAAIIAAWAAGGPKGLANHQP